LVVVVVVVDLVVVVVVVVKTIKDPQYLQWNNHSLDIEDDPFRFIK
jgi:hypothetical protein